MKGAEVLSWLKVGGVAVLGFVAVKAGLEVANKVKQGAAVATAAGEAVAKVVTEDLNPASTKNVVYKAANTVTGGDQDRPLGVRLWEWLHPGAVAAEKAATVGTQGTSIQEAQENFRRAEIEEQNAMTSAQVAEEQMSRARSNFRISEIVAENREPVYPSFSR